MNDEYHGDGGVESAGTVPRPLPANGKIDPNSVFGLDNHLATDGYWATIDGFRFKIARANNPVHEAYLARMGESKLRAYQNSTLSADQSRVVSGELVAHSFLRDWDERFVDYSIDRAIDFCVRNPHITTQIIAIATDYHNYLLQERDADAKN